VRDVTDTSGVLQQRYDYAPFGAASRIAGSGTEALQFTAMPVNQATGLLMMENRAYDSGLGRWLNEDPIGWKAGPNLYAYVLENPIRWIDPNGTFPRVPKPLPNGNWTSTISPQDYTCSLDIAGSSILSDFANNNRCTLNCCIQHDNCYKANHCNYSSWLTFGMGSCGTCNLNVLGCVLQGSSGPRPCTSCP
jgi:RHS repeat-associated protein